MTASTTKTLEDTILFIRDAHAGQLDKAGKPYHQHVERVHQLLLRLDPEANLEIQQAALLHDVIEDTDHDSDSLQALGFSVRTVSIVEELTRDKREGSYLQWIQAIAEHGSREALLVKLADNLDNGDPTRLGALGEAASSLQKRYLGARATLAEALVRRFDIDAVIPLLDR